MLNSETQLLSVFLLTLAAVYVHGGPKISKALDEQATDIQKSLQEVDNSVFRASQEAIEENKLLLTIKNDYQALSTIVDDLSVAQADLLNYTNEHKYRDAIVKKLDALVTLEDAVSGAVRQKLVASVSKDVLHQFQNDKKVKDAALDQAIAVLASGSSAKLGKDVVGAVFQSSIKAYRDDFTKKAPPELEELLATLKKDAEALSVAPVVEYKGGNVYETHPVLK